MPRYWSQTCPYDQPYINVVTDFVPSTRTVWSPSPKTAPPGYRSDATRNGGFPTEELTDAYRATIRVRKRVNQDEKISAGRFSRFLTLI